MRRIIENILRNNLIPENNYIYGFADLTGLLKKDLSDFNYGISIGRRLDTRIVNKIKDGPTRDYYMHYKNINDELALVTAKISSDLNQRNIFNYRIAPTVSTSDLDTIYLKTLRTELSHKMVATRAGLGWIGKSDLFISKKFGPRLRLVSILLKEKVTTRSKPINISRCGKCTICIDACPAMAANGKLWDITTVREDFFNPWKCREQCAKFGRALLGNDARICGICVSVCPVGIKNNNS
jgi:epoxyqueuosine reductase